MITKHLINNDVLGCPGGMSPPFDSEIMASMHNASTIHEIKVRE